MCTYASKPQRRVRDFCWSLSDLSEFRRALNFPSRAGHLFIQTGRRVRNHENSLDAAGRLILSNPLLEFCLSTPTFSFIILSHMFVQAFDALKIPEPQNPS